MNLVIIPLANWPGGFLGESLEIRLVVLPVNSTGSMDRCVAELIDLDLEPEIVSDERPISRDPGIANRRRSWYGPSNEATAAEG